MSNKIEVTNDMLTTGATRYKIAAALAILVGLMGGIAIWMIIAQMTAIPGLVGPLVALAALVFGIIAARQRMDIAYAIENKQRQIANETV